MSELEDVKNTEGPEEDKNITRRDALKRIAKIVGLGAAGVVIATSCDPFYSDYSDYYSDYYSNYYSDYYSNYYSDYYAYYSAYYS